MIRLWLVSCALLAALGQDAADARALAILGRAKLANAEHGGWHESKGTLLQAIAIAQARAGDRRAADGTLGEVLQAAPMEEANVLAAKARSGDVSGAVAQASALIRDGWSLERQNPPFGQMSSRPVSLRTHSLEKILGFLIESKRWEEALAVANLLPDKPREGHQVDMTAKQEGLHKLAVAQAKAGDPAAAQVTASLIKSVYYQQEALKDIVAAWILRGDLKEALKTDASITHPHLKIPTLIAIATAQAKAGEKAGAAETFQRAIALATGLTDFRAGPQGRVTALCQIAAAQAQAGEPAAALETMKQAMQGSDEPDLLNIAVGQARIGALDLALTKADAIKDAWRRVYALTFIADAIAESGNRAKAEELYSKARTVSLTIPNDYDRTRSLQGVGKAQLAAGFEPAALETVKGMTLQSSETWDLQLLIVKAQVASGELKNARTTADLIRVPWMKQTALREVALGLGRAGDLKAALEIVDPMQGGIQAQTFEDLSSILVERGELEPALQMARRIDMTEPAGRAMRKVAQAQVSRGDENGALAWAAVEKGSLQKAYALLGIAEGILDKERRNR